MIEWRTTIHDVPVKLMLKCPFMPHLILSVSGYNFAVWNEGVMVSVFGLLILAKHNLIIFPSTIYEF